MCVCTVYRFMFVCVCTVGESALANSLAMMRGHSATWANTTPNLVRDDINVLTPSVERRCCVGADGWSPDSQTDKRKHLTHANGSKKDTARPQHTHTISPRNHFIGGVYILHLAMNSQSGVEIASKVGYIQKKKRS